MPSLRNNNARIKATEESIHQPLVQNIKIMAPTSITMESETQAKLQAASLAIMDDQTLYDNSFLVIHKNNVSRIENMEIIKFGRVVKGWSQEDN